MESFYGGRPGVPFIMLSVETLEEAKEKTLEEIPLGSYALITGEANYGYMYQRISKDMFEPVIKLETPGPKGDCIKDIYVKWEDKANGGFIESVAMSDKEVLPLYKKSTLDSEVILVKVKDNNAVTLNGNSFYLYSTENPQSVNAKKYAEVGYNNETYYCSIRYINAHVYYVISIPTPTSKDPLERTDKTVDMGLYSLVDSVTADGIDEIVHAAVDKEMGEYVKKENGEVTGNFKIGGSIVDSDGNSLFFKNNESGAQYLGSANCNLIVQNKGTRFLENVQMDKTVIAANLPPYNCMTFVLGGEYGYSHYVDGLWCEERDRTAETTKWKNLTYYLPLDYYGNFDPFFKREDLEEMWPIRQTHFDRGKGKIIRSFGVPYDGFYEISSQLYIYKGVQVKTSRGSGHIDFRIRRDDEGDDNLGSSVARRVCIVDGNYCDIIIPPSMVYLKKDMWYNWTISMDDNSFELIRDDTAGNIINYPIESYIYIKYLGSY